MVLFQRTFEFVSLAYFSFLRRNCYSGLFSSFPITNRSNVQRLKIKYDKYDL